MSTYPFTQTKKAGKLIREFSKDVDSSELSWHRDREDREVCVQSGYGWQLQLENSVPKRLTPGEMYFIPKNTYHRVIKGRSDLVVEITEMTSEETLRGVVREILSETVEFHELDSPLDYHRSRNVKRLAYCDTSVTEPPGRHDAYFKEYQEMERYGRSGRRLKKPRPGKIIPGVSNVCVIGFLDYHDYGTTEDGKKMWYIDYMKTRGDHQGQGVASKLLDEFFERYAEPGGMIHFGKMMRKEIGHLKDKMAEKYPDVTVIGAVNF